MDGGGQRGLNFVLEAEVGPEGGCELRASIGDDGIWEPVEFPDMVDVKVGDVVSAGHLVAADQMSHLSEVVHYYQFCVVAFPGCESGN